MRINLRKCTLNGYTRYNIPIFGECKVTNIFSTGKIFFLLSYAKKAATTGADRGGDDKHLAAFFQSQLPL